MKQFILIPAYQPGDQLPELVRALLAKGAAVVVVDDGSPEDFWSALPVEDSSFFFLRHTENRGKGAALKTGLSFLQKHFAPPFTVVTADADGQHTLEDILRVGQEAELHPEALILGARDFSGADVPARSRFGNELTRLTFRLASGQSLKDTQTGLRAFSDRLLPRLLSTQGSRYEYETNVLLDLAAEEIPLREVEIQTVYEEGNAASHFRPVRDSLRIYQRFFRFAAASLTGFAVDFLLFCLLSVLFTPLSGGLVLANVLARTVSAGVNYTLNRNLVFRQKEPVGQSLPRYALLAAGILLVNTLLVQGIVNLGAAAWAAKLLTELFLFVASYLIQHRFVFRHHPERKQREAMI